MKNLIITGLVALLASAQPALAQDNSQYGDRNDRQYGDHSARQDNGRYDNARQDNGRYDNVRQDNGRYDNVRQDNGRYDAYNSDRAWKQRGGASPTNRYMNTISWRGARYNPPQSRNFAWEQSKDLSYRDGISEVELWADARASQAWLEVVDGAVQFQSAEVVFKDGTRLPISMNGQTCARGYYPLADFQGWQDVSRVVVQARATTPGARVGLHLME